MFVFAWICGVPQKIVAVSSSQYSLTYKTEGRECVFLDKKKQNWMRTRERTKGKNHNNDDL